MKIASRGAIAPFLIMESLTEANNYIAEQGIEDVIHMSLGQPGKGVPPKVVEAAQDIMNKSTLGYTEAAGVRELRQRLSQHYMECYGLEVPWQHIFITVGSSSAFFLSLLAAFDHGDRVALVEPCYPAYRNVLEAMGLEPVLLPGSFDNNFQPNSELLEALDEPVQGLIISSPSNPTGTVMPRDQMSALIDYADSKNIRIISDEIYHNMTYNVEVESALAMSDKAIVINSFSKYFLMAGWRLGWVVAPPELLRSYESLVQNFFVSPPSLAQYAALEVFKSKDELDRTVEEYATNRGIVLDALRDIGFTEICPAQGAFYIYVKTDKFAKDSADFCRDMLHNTHVVAVAGHDFDKRAGGQFVRFSYSGTEAQVTEAMRRLKMWLKK